MRVLVGDDHPDVLRGLRLLFRAEGIDGVYASSPAEVLAAVQDEDIDVALLDLNYTRDTTSGVEGLDLLGRVRQLEPDLPVVVSVLFLGWLIPGTRQMMASVEANRANLPANRQSASGTQFAGRQSRGLLAHGYGSTSGAT